MGKPIGGVHCVPVAGGVHCVPVAGRDAAMPVHGPWVLMRVSLGRAPVLAQGVLQLLRSVPALPRFQGAGRSAGLARRGVGTVVPAVCVGLELGVLRCGDPSLGAGQATLGCCDGVSIVSPLRLTQSVASVGCVSLRLIKGVLGSRSGGDAVLAGRSRRRRSGIGGSGDTGEGESGEDSDSEGASEHGSPVLTDLPRHDGNRRSEPQVPPIFTPLCARVPDRVQGYVS